MNQIFNLAKPILKLKLSGLKTSSGRNNSGKITVRHKGGGHKRRFRSIDFCLRKSAVGIVSSIEYDPNRNGFICSVFNFINYEFYYFLAPEKIRIGDVLKSGLIAELALGHSSFFFKIPVGSFVYNVSNVYARSAGTHCEIKEKSMLWTLIELPSKKKKVVSSFGYASLGLVSNAAFVGKNLKKAGQSRWLNRRPTVRGVAMNPVDHVNGGGNGKKSGQDKTFWGKHNK